MDLMIQSTRPTQRLSLHILMPGLLGRLVGRARGAESFPRFAQIENLLARAQYGSTKVYGYEAQLCALFGITAEKDQDLPLGAIRRYGITGELRQDEFMCADPVYLQADIQQAYLYDGSQLQVDQKEAQIFVELFNRHFAAEAFYLEATHPSCWHLCLKQPQRLRTHPLRQVIGDDVSAHFPYGDHASYWRSILNETQMLYYGAEPNRKRETQGKMMLNSLWFYGSGHLPRQPQTSWDGLWGDDPLTRGLAKLVKMKLHKPPRDLRVLIEDGVRGKHLLCLDDLAVSSSYDHFSDWQLILQGLEKDWFTPLSLALKSGTISECVFYDCAGQQFKLRGSDRWRFWRKTKPLTELTAC